MKKTTGNTMFNYDRVTWFSEFSTFNYIGAARHECAF